MRDNNGEDRTKFTKEMLGLGHMLGEQSMTGGILTNDGTRNEHQKKPLILDAFGHTIKTPKKGNKLGQASRLEAKSPKHKNKQIMKESKEIKKWQEIMIDIAIDKELKSLLPKVVYWACNKWGWRWPLKVFGIKIKFGKLQKGLMGSTIIRFFVWGQPHSEDILKWDV